MTRPLLRYDLPAALVVSTVVAGATTVRWSSPLDHDVAHFLALAKMLAQGRNLYDDLIDQNTPAITSLGRVSIALAGATGLEIDRAHVLVVALTAAIAVAVGCLVVRRGYATRPAGYLTFVAAFVLAAFVVPAADFGRREHLFAVCAMPYFAAIVAHSRGVPRTRFATVSAGGLATFGVFLKPHFVAFAVAAATWDVVASRSRGRRVSNETWTVMLGTALIYGAFLVAEPRYWDTVVPLTAATFLQYRGPPLFALAQNTATLGLATTVLVAATLLGWIGDTRGLGRVALGLGWPLAAVGAAVVAVQAFGFAYHALPLRIWTTLASAMTCFEGIAFAIAPRVQRRGGSRRRIAGVAAVVAAGVGAHLLENAVTAQMAFTRGRPRSTILAHPFVRVLEVNGPDRYAYVFSSSVLPGGLAFVYSNTRWSGHMIPMFVLPILHDVRVDPGLYPGVDRDRLRQVEADERQRILFDFEHRTPDIVLLDVSKNKRYFRTSGFEYLRFLSEDERFASAWTAREYEEIGEVGDFFGRPFRLFVRSTSSVDRDALRRAMQPP